MFLVTYVVLQCHTAPEFQKKLLHSNVNNATSWADKFFMRDDDTEMIQEPPIVTMAVILQRKCDNVL